MALAAAWACSSSIDLKPLQEQMEPAGLNPDPFEPAGNGAPPDGNNPPSLSATGGGEGLGPTPLSPGSGGNTGTATDGRGGAPTGLGAAGTGGAGPEQQPVTPSCADGDGDGLCDSTDGCPAIKDDGSDRDGDGKPDACDLCADVPQQDDTRDSDADGKPNACDSCGIGVAIDLQPLFYFPLDEASTASVAVNLGSVPQTATYLGPIERGLAGVSDPSGRAIRLAGEADGAFSRVTLLNASSFPTTALTALFWVRTTQTGDFAILSYAIAGSQNEFGVVVEEGRMRLTLQSSTFVAEDVDASLISDGAWHFVALTWLETSAQFYFDGEAVGSALTTAEGFELIERAAVPVTGPLHLTAGGVIVLGQDQDSLNGGFDAAQALEGGLDEVAIYDRPLSAEQIRLIYNATTCGERCDGSDNDGDGKLDEGFLGSAPACPAASCAAISANASAFGSGEYYSSADPDLPLSCIF